MFTQKSSRDAFYDKYLSYVNKLQDAGVAKEKISEYVSNPFNRVIPRAHQQIYLNLNSMLCGDLLTEMGAIGLYDFDIEDLEAVRAKCLDELNSTKQNSCTC